MAPTGGNRNAGRNTLKNNELHHQLKVKKKISIPVHVNEASTSNTTKVASASSSAGKKRKQTPAITPVAKKAARYNTFVAGSDGKPATNITLIPTRNSFDGLNDDAEDNEIIIDSTKPAKLRIPPITVFNQSRQQVVDFLKKLGITQYSLKNLRHAVHLYCASADDFKKVREDMTSQRISNYTHDLNEEKLFKVALKGLHLMDVNELQEELTSLDLTPISIRTITPKNPRYTNNVVYVVEFKAGTIKFRELAQKRVVSHTVVQWEPYRRKEGVVQCSRCQRPGHGARNCNMPPRCCLCAEDHETLKCPSTEKKLQTAMSTGDDGNCTTAPLEVPILAKCCNCNAVGHFASDPKCPKKIAYIQSRRLRATAGRPDKMKYTPLAPTPRYSPGGPSFASIMRSGSTNLSPSGIDSLNNNVSPSGTTFHPGSLGPSGTFDSQFRNIHSSNFGPSGNQDDSPFTIEELTAMTFDVINSLKNVRHLPRSEAFMTVMNVAFKYLYRNG